MAKKTSVTKKTSSGKWQISWKNLWVSASVVLNIAFLVLLFTMFFTPTLDSVWIKEGLVRYCSDQNDDLYAGEPKDVQALRDFTCASGDAKPYFENALKIYLFSQGITETNKQ